MTMQMNDLAARQSPDGWTMAWVPHGGNRRIHLLDAQGDTLRSFDLASLLPEWSRFAHWTTAGMDWSENMLAYFTAGQRHLVVRAWWGGRLVIALDRLRPMDPQGLSDELSDTEGELVLRGLHRLVAATENGEQPRYDWPATDVTRCTVGTLVHFPGLLGLVEAVPLLRVLEERLVRSAEHWGSFRYWWHGARQLAQISIRRLGEKPRGYPALTFTESEDRALLRGPQPGPIDGATRHTKLARIGRFSPLTEVYHLLGAPDEVGRGAGLNFWRYDVDVDPPYTVLLWLREDDAVTRIVKYLPPFWTGPAVFPSRAHSLLGSDGRTVGAYVKELVDGTFVGTRIEVDLVQDLVALGWVPLAPLARAVLNGAHEALGPLADALEEVGDPRAHQVRAWINP